MSVYKVIESEPPALSKLFVNGDHVGYCDRVEFVFTDSTRQVVEKFKVYKAIDLQGKIFTLTAGSVSTRSE